MPLHLGRRAAIVLSGLIAALFLAVSAAPASAACETNNDRTAQFSTLTVRVNGAVVKSFSTPAEKAAAQQTGKGIFEGVAMSPGQTVGVDFTLNPDCQDVELGLASYTTASGTYKTGENQTLSDHKGSDDTNGVNFDAGMTYSLVVTLPACTYQVDFFRGRVHTNPGAAPYGTLLVGANNGGAPCTTGTPPTGTPPTSTPPTSTPPTSTPPTSGPGPITTPNPCTETLTKTFTVLKSQPNTLTVTPTQPAADGGKGILVTITGAGVSKTMRTSSTGKAAVKVTTTKAGKLTVKAAGCLAVKRSAGAVKGVRKSSPVKKPVKKPVRRNVAAGNPRFTG